MIKYRIERSLHALNKYDLAGDSIKEDLIDYFLSERLYNQFTFSSDTINALDKGLKLTIKLKKDKELSQKLEAVVEITDEKVSDLQEKIDKTKFLLENYKPFDWKK